jgi:DUF4097 and DUF4098 domain-containing protein YvlB
MSSMPPNVPPGNVPPGGGAPPPYPPYDPRTDWRAYRQQQKAAWRAQRDAWKANRIGMYGPRVPSIVGPVVLVTIGAVWLLIQSGHISGEKFWAWYGHWWPILLIAAGIAMLGEWALDMRRSAPVRRRSHIGLILLLVFIGLIASSHNHFAPWMHNWQFNDDDFSRMFSEPEHDYDMPALSAPIPANSLVEIDNPRGDVKIAASDGATVTVDAHEEAFANQDSDAKNIFSAEAPHLNVNGSAVSIVSNGNSNGRVNLTVTVPRTARVTVNSTLEDVTATGLGAGIDVTARGDIHLSSITGPVVVHFTNGKHDDFFAQDVQGDVTLDGDVNDVTLSGIKGGVKQNGDIPGDVHLQNVTGPIHLHTSVTDLQLATLEGDLTLDNDDLRVTGSKGPVHLTTHSKDVDLSQIAGDTSVVNRDGSISIELDGNYAVDARNSKGDVDITLPANAQATVDGSTHNGDIVTDFGLSVSGDTNKSVSGRIGAGGSKISLSTSNGDLRIKRGSAAFTKSSVTAEPMTPVTPAAPGTRHLKADGALPKQPVTQ